MKEKEAQLKGEVKDLLAEAAAADPEEDALYGKDHRGVID
jgi:hypothetical protein